MSKRAENTIFGLFLDNVCLFGRCFCLVALSNARPLELQELFQLRGWLEDHLNQRRGRTGIKLSVPKSQSKVFQAECQAKKLKRRSCFFSLEDTALSAHFLVMKQHLSIRGMPFRFSDLAFVALQLSISENRNRANIAAFQIAKCKIASFSAEIARKNRRKITEEFLRARNKNRSVSAFSRSRFQDAKLCNLYE